MSALLKKHEAALNDRSPRNRLAALRQLADLAAGGTAALAEKKEHMVNNHIHTTYSFSPYSPARAVWEASKSGLVTAGIVDHDSLGGAYEFVEAGRILDMPTTVGIECRADFSATLLGGRRINNPDQKSVAYIVLHGIPHQNIEKIADFFAPYRAERNRRNRVMVDNINRFFQSCGVEISFNKDVLPISEYDNGGTVTERHLLFALSSKLVERYGKGERLLNVLEDRFARMLTPDIRNCLLNPQNPFYRYDLLGLLKKDTSYFFVEAENECPPVDKVVDLALAEGAIPAYAYLGDVKESVTGDKKAQKFEDDYLDLLFRVLKGLGFRAIAYMPSRNELGQLLKVKSLCAKYDLFQISGEDINSPRQSFICDFLKKKEFANLIDSTWALIGHEKAATGNVEDGMFSDKTVEKYPCLDQRIDIYKKLGSGHK